MPRILRTNSEHPDFVRLVSLLDAELAIMDGKEHDFYAQFNKIDHLNHVVLAYDEDRAIACGAFKKINQQCVEIKRMYTSTEYRAQGVAKQVLASLEDWAVELSYTEARLETGRRQLSAITLYTNQAYQRTDNYGPYVDVDNSICFYKVLAH